MTRELVERAREFRKKPTRAEALLWHRLRNRAGGAKFRRQSVVGPFIPDFVCRRPRVAVEVDGPVHHGRPEHDLERQQWLESRGYTVLRFTIDERERDPDAVVARIIETIGHLGGR